mgnify:CR=1 FL=1
MSAARWEDYFLPGETLLWQGAPLPGIHRWAPHLLYMLLGVPFFAAGLWLTYHTARFGLLEAATVLDRLGAFVGFCFGLPFLGIGLFCLLGHWVMAALAPRRVRYALSSRAAYIARRFWGRALSVYPIQNSGELEVKTSGRAGSVWFHSQSLDDSDGEHKTFRAGFENIAEAEQVLRLLRQIQMQS